MLDAAPVIGPDDIAEVSAGGYNTCVVLGSGDTWCWGNASGGRIGDLGYTGPQPTPIHVPIGVAVHAIDVNDGGRLRADAG